MAELSEIFWTFLITSIIGLIIALARMIYKSKCKNFECCGFKIERDTEAEEREMEFQAIHHTETNDNNLIRNGL